MSGIYISGMELPGHCWQCPFHDEVDDCIILKKSCVAVWGEYRRHPDCPLVPVPDHGRLGDLDAMAKDETVAFISAQEKMGHDVIGWQVNTIVHAKIQKLIEDTPTIIPADKERDP